MSRNTAMSWVLFLSLIGSPTLWAQTTVTLLPSLDNSMFSESPNNSAGAEENLFVGITNGGNERRSLIAFQDLSSIPAGSIVTAVALNMATTRGIGPPIDVALFATTRAWSEGGSNPSNQGGQGSPAQAGDATWDVAIFPRSSSTLWQNPGGDFSATELSRTLVENSGNVTFPSTDLLVAEVQNWLDGGNNTGLILISQLNQSRSAKRLGSKENGSPANRPTLSVTYTSNGEGDSTALAVSGLWFDENLPGDGFNVIESAQQIGQHKVGKSPKGSLAAANNLTIFYFGYDAGGARLWLVSETIPGPLRQNQPLTFSMLVGGTSGSFLRPAPGSELSVWGTLEVTLTDCNRGVFELRGADGDKRFDASQLTAVEGVNCVGARAR